MSWPTTKIGSVCRVLPGYAFRSSDFTDSGIPVVKIASIKDDLTVDVAGGQCLPEGLVTERTRRFLLKDGDIVLAMTGATAGKIGRIVSDAPMVLNQRVAKIEPAEDDADYVWCILSSARYRDRFYNLAGGAAQPNLSGGQIEETEMPWPPSDARRRIGDAITSYDDLITNNMRRIELLEQSARLLFKEWFVYLRYPGHEHDKIVDGVPVRWIKAKIGDLGEVITGKTPSKAVQENFGDDVPFIKTPDLHGAVIVIECGEMLSDRGAQTQANKYIPPLSTMVSCIGSVGVVAMNATIAQTNQQINTIVPVKPHYTFYNYFFAQSLKARLEGLGGGATMANVNKGKFESLECILPPEPLLISFDEFCRPLFDMVLSLKKQVRNAGQARELLLPRLMDGRLAV